ncbi:transcription factor domain-containing protein [Aspergillus lucknowensis]|uniref:Fungal-specific transcription factor domain-containing protein n=1 Tax=Aspergillus lucknowensis TaxID=176173 RepID=A0ABR4LUI7_9EURO
MPRREIAPGRSCLECRRRKIKCDRARPCAYCVRVRIACKYPTQRTALDEDPTALDRMASLESKLRAVEKRLSEITDSPRSSLLTGATSSRGDESYISHSSDMERLGGRESRPPSIPSSSILLPQPYIEIERLRPPPATIALLWQKYLDVVDPLLKTFHTPTVQKLVMKAVRGRDGLDSPSECLLFVIYYATVAAMSEEDCRAEFEEERSVLLKEYRAGVEYLLSRLNVLESSDLMVLQALTIYLITGRCDENGPDVYALVGLAVGMALKMGLNRDGAETGLSPFQVEMRRRLWWQLCILDVRVAEDRRSEPCILESSFNTRLPSNVSDANLHPDMSRLPGVEHGRTEMLFSLVRFEGSYFARQMVFSDTFSEANGYIKLSTAQKCQAIDLFQERIEKQYLSYCDDRIPLDKITMLSMRLIITRLKLTVISQTSLEAESKYKSKAQRRDWMTLLQDAETLRAYEPGKQWLWLFQTYIEWDALAHLLLHLRNGPFGDDASTAWQLAYRVYNHWKDAQATWRDHRWKQIEELRLEVLRSRQMAHANQVMAGT